MLLLVLSHGPARPKETQVTSVDVFDPETDTLSPTQMAMGGAAQRTRSW